jgi:hypothetical protein
MARFRKIAPRIWNDAKFREVSDDAKLIFFLLLTHPHMTALGAMRATEAGLAAELGWFEERFHRSFAELLQRGMALYDERAAMIWLPNFLKYNSPENPNVVKSWQGSLDLLPECDLKAQVIHACRRRLETLPEGFAEGFTEGFAKPFRKSTPNQEQEPEHEPQKEDHSPLLSPSPDEPEDVLKDPPEDNGHNPWPSPEALMAKYNAGTPPCVPKVRTLSPARRQRAQRYLTLFPEESFWGDIFAEYHHSSFLQGVRAQAGHERFKADFDWLLSQGKDGLENCVKVHEGKYRDRSHESPTRHNQDARAAHNLAAMETFLKGGSDYGSRGS